MDATRIHLFLTHLPLFGIFLSLLVLLFGIYKRDKQVKVVAQLIIMVSLIGGVIAFQTGHEAEETVERIAGISENAIEEHEELAEVTVILFYATGILSLGCLYFLSTEKSFLNPVLWVLVAVMGITLYFVARTASLGGKIRHTEIVDQSHSGDAPGN